MWFFSGGAGRGKEEAARDWDAHGLPATGTPVPASTLDAGKRYKVSEVDFLDRRRIRRPAAADKNPLFSTVAAALRPGGVYTRAQLLEQLQAMDDSGRFERVDLHTKPRPDGTLGVTVSYAESAPAAADRFTCVNVGHMATAALPYDGLREDMSEAERMDYLRRRHRAGGAARPCILPDPVCEEVLGMVKKQGNLSSRLLRTIRDRVEEWYHGEGFACAQVVGYGKLDSGDVVCEVVEGDITRVDYVFQDKLGNVVDGNTRTPLIDRQLPQQLRPGQIYNIGAGKQALKGINSLGLFSDVEVNPRPDESKEGGVVVEIKLKELEPMSGGVAAECSIVPGRQGRSIHESIQPRGTVTVGNRNISGLNRSLVGSVTLSNLLNPQDDLSFNLEYAHPYVDGVEDRTRNRTFKASFFNNRKSRPVFGSNMDIVPPFWVDRVGFKANITENFTRQSKLTYGIVMEETTTRDENKNIGAHGSHTSSSGSLSTDGPPTAFNGTGVDRTAFLQANITRDNTEFVNGAAIGDRCIFQVDQGLGVGTSRPFFNRHQLSVTKFINLNNQQEDAGKPPPAVLAVHGRYAGCVGDQPSYDAFSLGGPRSFRGYGMGGPGSSRNLLEISAELRIPITVMNTHTQVYAFAEHGTELGSYMELNENPAEFFRRACHASSYGVGVRFGPLRAEYAIDHNDGTGAFSLRFGERF
ncbi:hypothetical protein ACP70R_001616 [Stipagrostis hirtigluma subsp. patula]